MGPVSSLVWLTYSTAPLGAFQAKESSTPFDKERHYQSSNNQQDLIFLWRPSS
jgi:hypothetical protein